METIEQMIAEINEIRARREASGLNGIIPDVALRVLPGGIDYVCGDKLPNSYVWVDGEMTNEEMAGVACWMGKNDYETVELAMKYLAGYAEYERPTAEKLLERCHGRIGIIAGIHNGYGYMPERGACLLIDCVIEHIVQF